MRAQTRTRSSHGDAAALLARVASRGRVFAVRALCAVGADAAEAARAPAVPPAADATRRTTGVVERGPAAFSTNSAASTSPPSCPPDRRSATAAVAAVIPSSPLTLFCAASTSLSSGAARAQC